MSRRDLTDSLLSEGFVLVVEPVDPSADGHRGWWRADLFLDLPTVPAEHRRIGVSLEQSADAALSELRACVAERRVAGSPEFFCAPDAYRARLLAGCERAAAALAAAGVPLPTDHPDQEIDSP